jgi:hypothetical protein
VFNLFFAPKKRSFPDEQDEEVGAKSCAARE